MPETKRRRSETAEFVAAIVIAAVIFIAAYLIGDALPAPVTTISLVILGFAGVAAAATAIVRREDRR